MSIAVQRRSGHRGKPRQVVESDEEDISNLPGSMPRSQKVFHTVVCITLQY